MKNERTEDNHERKTNDSDLLELMNELSSIPEAYRFYVLEKILTFTQGAAAVARTYANKSAS